MTEWATSVVESVGAWGLFALVVLESVFPPIPSEVVLPLAGFAVSTGQMSFPVALLAATAGALTGAFVLYGLGALVGEERLLRLAARHGRLVLLRESDVVRAGRWFERHGPAAVLAGRCVPGVRSVISIPAGVTRMPLPRFALYTALGSALWNSLLIGAGWALGSSWRRVTDGVELYAYLVLAAIVAGVAWLFVRRLRARAARNSAG